ncbi:peptide ABC transporter ATP-binding protein [Vulcanibacillus modesticaldus]|uniref:Peptide ABC transporter ATP-binding protein n=1 Tax=Vulcanibacillus modesticaldus TaxID=337097 RepID=A0A1D2YUJ7_9BACI|nr:ABC transporter ATP-binding protein [Vulcanibacillus modesticaldus]OEF99388.1 peptide ABC transporter ATP-binding protein [Vulcanibacillus modesticaldus]
MDLDKAGENVEEDYVLEVDQLKTIFRTEDGDIPAVSGVSFSLKAGETLGIVGESGSGKSVTSLSIMGLIPKPQGRLSGSIRYKGKEIINLSEGEMREIRGNEISMIFQEPMTSLNPVFTIGNQMVEAVLLHMELSKKEAEQRAIEMLRQVGIPRAEEIMKEYPHQLSGGMRQRVMIAMAMSCNPSILIADEPTTALDVTIQAQILDLMRNLKKDFNTSILLITHDLGVVAEMCDRVIVMYAGKIVEESDVRTLFKNPNHPYTKGLIKSTPRLTSEKQRLYSIPGNVPSFKEMPKGCKFVPRCEYAKDICYKNEPELVYVGEDHKSSCWLNIEQAPSIEEDAS